jgi:hypothetical protein
VSGNITDATVHATGTGSITLDSPTLKTVDARLAGISNLLVIGGDGESQRLLSTAAVVVRFSMR